MFLKAFKIFFLLIIYASLLSCTSTNNKKTEIDESTTKKLLMQLALDAESAYDYKNAAQYYERLHQLETSNRVFISGLAKNLRYIGQSKEAIRLIKEYRNSNTLDNKLTLELSKSQFASKMFNEASITLKTVYDSLKGNWEYYNLNGLISDHQEYFTDAQISYRKALILSPENLTVLNNLALSYAQNGQVEEGIRILEKVNRTEESTLQTRQNLALLYGIFGENKKSSTLMKKDLPESIVKHNKKILRQFRN